MEWVYHHDKRDSALFRKDNRFFFFLTEKKVNKLYLDAKCEMNC